MVERVVVVGGGGGGVVERVGSCPLVMACPLAMSDFFAGVALVASLGLEGDFLFLFGS